MPRVKGQAALWKSRLRKSTTAPLPLLQNITPVAQGCGHPAEVAHGLMVVEREGQPDAARHPTSLRRPSCAPPVGDAGRFRNRTR